MATTTRPQPGSVSTPSRSASTLSQSTSLTVLQEIEEGYNKKLDTEVSQLLESFSDIVKVAKIQDTDRVNAQKDKYRIAQEAYQVECRAANIVRSAETLLTLVTELKQSLLLNDTRTLVQFSSNRFRKLKRQKRNIQLKIAELKDGLDRTVWELERACYGGVEVE